MITETAGSKTRIRIHCPQCGGEMDFLEEAQVIRCEFCGASLLVAGREGVLRYVLPAQVTDPRVARALALKRLREAGRRNPQPLEAFLFYAPYWRLQGTAFHYVFGRQMMKTGSFFQADSASGSKRFSWNTDLSAGQDEVIAPLPPPMEMTKELLCRPFDHTIPGYADLDLGLPSLGVRVQAIPLQPFSREHLEQRESFLPLGVPLEQIQSESETLGERLIKGEKLNPEIILSRFVGKRFSVIYFPLWYVECQHGEGKEALLVDGVGESILPARPDFAAVLKKLRGEESRKSYQFSEIRFLPFRCPNCGWTFPFHPFSILHFCSTCRRLWRERGGEWVESGYQTVLPPPGAALDRLLWIPFWRCRTAMESGGGKLETMADLYRIAPPLHPIDLEKEAHRPIYFYVPSVKFRNPQPFYTLASRLSFRQPEVKLGPFADNTHPLAAGGSLPAEDAMDLGLVILGDMIPAKNRKAREWVKGCRVELKDPQVLYFPFAQLDLFWKELCTGLSFQKNALGEPPLPNKPE